MVRNVLITGATGNLGRATVSRFLNAGYTVNMIVSPGKGDDYRGTDNLFAFEADLSDEAQARNAVDKIVAAHGEIYAALLLVGGFAAGDISSTGKNQLSKMISMNFETAYFVARPVFEAMKKQNKGGRIVLIGSRAPLFANEGRNSIAYGLAKSLVFKLAEYLNEEGASSNIVTSVIVPGTIDTPQNRAAMPDSDFSRWVSPDEIAAAMEFLCKPDNGALREPVLKLFGKA